MKCKRCNGTGSIVAHFGATHLNPPEDFTEDCPAGCVFCEECETFADKLVPFEVDPWGKVHSSACQDCVDNYEGPEPDYGEGNFTQAERYREAAEQKERMRK